VFAFQFKHLADETAACELAGKRPNFSVYARDKAMMNGAKGEWVLPLDLPSKDWAPIRSTYWGKLQPGNPDQFLLGAVEPFCKFFATSRSAQLDSLLPVLNAPP
jgi:hypothetical protein